MIKVSDLKKQIKEFGAKATASKLALSVNEGHLPVWDLPSLRTLYECFVTVKKDDYHSIGNELLYEETLSEEAAISTSMDAFNILTSQIYFNALTTRYNPAEFNIQGLFRVIPSTLASGEKFGGLSNLNKQLQPVGFGKELPALEPTQDYSASPPMLQHGALVDINLPMMKADASGEIMDMFQHLGDALYTTRELESVAILTDLNSTRTRYNWKQTSYATYQTSTPWVNQVGSNALLTPQSLNAAYQALQNVVDPFTGLPVVIPPARLKLICTPELEFTASRLKFVTQYRTGGGTNTDFTPTVLSTGDVPGVDFDIVSSKYLKYWNDNNGGTNTTWYLCYPEIAFSWQQMYPINVSESVPNAGDMFRRNIAASYKAFKIEAGYTFNPRYSIRNTVAA